MLERTLACLIGLLAIEAANARRDAKRANDAMRPGVAIGHELYAKELDALHVRSVAALGKNTVVTRFIADERAWTNNELTFLGRVSQDTGEIAALLAKSRALTFYRDTLATLSDSEATQEVAVISDTARIDFD